MSLHSTEYIRRELCHDPNKVLSLRNDEVSVFSRISFGDRRKISSPAKLYGIEEKAKVNQSTYEEVKNETKDDSYLRMKKKLDEYEAYNKHLEDQLNSIFNKISECVKKAEPSSSSRRTNEQYERHLPNIPSQQSVLLEGLRYSAARQMCDRI